MRKILFIPLLFCSLISFSQSNKYAPFPINNAIWNEHSGGYQCSCCSDYVNKIERDTIINGKLYGVVRHKGVNYQDDVSGNCTSIISNLFNYEFEFIRNDTINKKVYCLYPDSVNESLLYDFDLKLNDELKPTLLNHIDTTFGHKNVVTQIDSILIESTYRKVFGISYTTSTNDTIKNYTSIIEGIGNEAGLFAGLVPFFESSSFLSCLSVNGKTIYPEPTSICNDINGIVSLKKENEPTFFPNPFNEKTTIQLPEGMVGANLILYDAVGRKLSASSNISKSFTLEKANFQPGVYFYIIEKGINRFSGKLILIK